MRLAQVVCGQSAGKTRYDDQLSTDCGSFSALLRPATDA